MLQCEDKTKAAKSSYRTNLIETEVQKNKDYKEKIKMTFSNANLKASLAKKLQESKDYLVKNKALATSNV